MEQLLAAVTLSADVRPLFFLDGSQRRAVLENAPETPSGRATRYHFGKRRRTRYRLGQRLRPGLFPKPRQRYPGKWRARFQTGQFGDRRRHVAETDRLADSPLGRAAPWRNDEQRNVQLGFVKTVTVTENAGVFSETFAMVGG